MKYISLDIETEDVYLKDHGAVKARGTSCVFGRGRIIVVGTYDGKQKKSYDGNGGATIKKLFLSPNVTIIGANIQYDAVWLILSHGINPKDVKCHFIDVSVVESLIDEYQKYALDDLAVKYLNEHIDRDVSLDKLAKKFYVSKYYLCRAFKKHNGISVHGYINQKRVMYAKQLIESGETASAAAYRVGFGDYSAFYRAYVKIVGRAPTSQQTEVIINEL